MNKLEQLAEEYSKEQWGVYYGNSYEEAPNLYYGECTERDYIAGYKKAIENIDWSKIEEECEKLDFGYQTGSLITEFFKEQINKQLNGE